MRGGAEHGVGHPGDAFAAHLYQARSIAVHPRRHEMAADARLRARALRHLGGTVVRAAGTEVGQAAHAVGRIRQQRGRREAGQQAAAVECRLEARQPLRQHAGDARRAQLALCRQQRRAVRIELAQHQRARAVRQVVEQGADLLFHHRPLFLDDEDFPQARLELRQALRFERKAQAHLVQAHAGALQHIEAEAQAAQHFEHVEVRLAAGDDADIGLRAGAQQAVDAVGARERVHGGQLVRVARLDGQAGQVGPAVMQAAGRRAVVGRLVEARVQGVQVDRGAAFHRFGNGLEAHPHAGKARQRPAVQAKFQVFGDAGRIDDGHAPRLHGEIALVRHR